MSQLRRPTLRLRARLRRLLRTSQMRTTGALIAVVVLSAVITFGFGALLVDTARGSTGGFGKPLEFLGVCATVGGVVGLVIALLAARILRRPMRRMLALSRSARDGSRPLESPAESSTDADEVMRTITSLQNDRLLMQSVRIELLRTLAAEVRAPLTSIHDHAEALADDMVDHDAMPHTGEHLLRETRRLEALANDLLALARLDSDDVDIQSRPVNLGGILVQAEQTWRERCTAFGVTLRLRLPLEMVVVLSDGARLRDALDALLGSALRATPTGGQIVLSGEDDDGVARIEVLDSGAPLSRDDAARALESGVRPPRDRQLHPVGSALGLSVAARLADALDGRLTVTASELGTRFRFEIRALEGSRR